MIILKNLFYYITTLYKLILTTVYNLVSIVIENIFFIKQYATKS